jgi:putative PIN family toxin of toxin-antitoxin system
LRAVLDVNVLISALLSPAGASARLLRAWQEGRFELFVSPGLLAELGRALAYRKLRQLIPESDAEAFVAWLSRSAVLVRDPGGPPPIRSVDPGDDHLLSLAADLRAVLVSGDAHLLALAGEFLVQAPPEFLALVIDATR